MKLDPRVAVTALVGGFLLNTVPVTGCAGLFRAGLGAAALSVVAVLALLGRAAFALAPFGGINQ